MTIKVRVHSKSSGFCEQFRTHIDSVKTCTNLIDFSGWKQSLVNICKGALNLGGNTCSLLVMRNKALQNQIETEIELVHAVVSAVNHPLS